MKNIIGTLISILNIESKSSTIMAVPKKRRSKSKGRVRLSNWKKKAKNMAKKALNAAKKFRKEKKGKEIIEKNDSVVPSTEVTSEEDK